MSAPTHPAIPARVLRHLALSLEGCWTWTASTVPGGYGRTRFGSAMMVAHKAVWLWVNGPIVGDLKVCHRCDNPPCCNPAHLFLGTQKQNVEDCIAKGRARKRDAFRARQVARLGFASKQALGYHLRKGVTDEALALAERSPSGRLKYRCGACGAADHNRRTCKAA